MESYEKIVALWRSYNIETLDELDKHLDSFNVLFAFNSGRLENDDITYHDTREIFKNGTISNYTGSPNALFVQQNQKLCTSFLKAKVLKREPISIDLIKEIHRIMTRGTYDDRRYIENAERPGEYKKHDYVTGYHEVGSPVEDVKQDMDALVTEINAYTGAEQLMAAAYLHARFEYIHPFADGNGRVGRLILNYYLMINNHPPVIIYDEDKREYYGTLQEYDETEELAPLYNFLKRQCEKTWTRALRMSEGNAPARRSLTDFITPDALDTRGVN